MTRVNVPARVICISRCFAPLLYLFGERSAPGPYDAQLSPSYFSLTPRFNPLIARSLGAPASDFMTHFRSVSEDFMSVVIKRQPAIFPVELNSHLWVFVIGVVNLIIRDNIKSSEIWQSTKQETTSHRSVSFQRFFSLRKRYGAQRASGRKWNCDQFLFRLQKDILLITLQWIR